MERLKSKNKRGAMTDLFLFMIIAFALSIAVVVLVYAGTTVYTHLANNIGIFDNVLEGTGENATDVLNNSVGKSINAYESLKWITGMLIVGMILAMVITSFTIQTRPWFFTVFLLVWIIAIIVSFPLSNAYETVYNNPVLSATFVGFWSQTFIMLNLPIWIIVIGGLQSIVLYVNMIKSGQYGGYA